MAENQKPEPDDKEQSKRFEETARLLESEESGKSFENALKNIRLTGGNNSVKKSDK